MAEDITVDPTAIRSRSEFASALMHLRAAACITLRELAGMVGTPTTTLHGWFVGRHLPYPRNTELFLRVLVTLGVVDTAPWVAALSRVRALPTNPTGPTPVVMDLPGLRHVGWRSRRTVRRR